MNKNHRGFKISMTTSVCARTHTHSFMKYWKVYFKTNTLLKKRPHFNDSSTVNCRFNNTLSTFGSSTHIALDLTIFLGLYDKWIIHCMQLCQYFKQPILHTRKLSEVYQLLCSRQHPLLWATPQVPQPVRLVQDQQLWLRLLLRGQRRPQREVRTTEIQRGKNDILSFLRVMPDEPDDSHPLLEVQTYIYPKTVRWKFSLLHLFIVFNWAITKQGKTLTCAMSVIHLDM